MMSMLPGAVVAAPQVASTALGLEYLGGVKSTSPVASIVTPTFGARDGLIVFVGITGLSAAAHVGLRCNGLATAVYWSRTFSSSGLAAGLVTFGNNQLASQPEIDLEGGTSTNLHRHWFVTFSNRLAMAKTASWQGSLGSATNAPVTSILGAGEWVNTTAQITSLTLVALSGATLNAGCRLHVFGRNYP